MAMARIPVRNVAYDGWATVPALIAAYHARQPAAARAQARDSDRARDWGQPRTLPPIRGKREQRGV